MIQAAGGRRLGTTGPWRLRDFFLAGSRCPLLLAVILITSFTYLLQLLLGPHEAVGLDNPVFRSLADWAPWTAHGQIWRPVTYIFLHQSGWHLWGNMWPLFLFGPLVAARYGAAWFGVAYLVCGTAGELAAMGLTHLPGFTAGASIAVYGIHGVVIAITLFHLSETRMRVYLVAALLSVVDELWPFTATNLHTNQGHISGIVAGLALGVGLEVARKLGGPTWSRGVVCAGVVAVGASLAAAGWPIGPVHM